MKKIILSISLLLCLLLTLAGCEGVTVVKFEGVEIDQTSVVDYVNYTEFDVTKIKLIVHYTDHDEIKYVSKEFISEEDLLKIQAGGLHTINIRYRGKNLPLTIFLLGDDISHSEKDSHEVVVYGVTSKVSGNTYICRIGLAGTTEPTSIQFALAYDIQKINVSSARVVLSGSEIVQLAEVKNGKVTFAITSLNPLAECQILEVTFTLTGAQLPLDQFRVDESYPNRAYAQAGETINEILDLGFLLNH